MIANVSCVQTPGKGTGKALERRFEIKRLEGSKGVHFPETTPVFVVGGCEETAIICEYFAHDDHSWS